MKKMVLIVVMLALTIGHGVFSQELTFNSASELKAAFKTELENAKKDAAVPSNYGLGKSGFTRVINPPENHSTDYKLIKVLSESYPGKHYAHLMFIVEGNGFCYIYNKYYVDAGWRFNSNARSGIRFDDVDYQDEGKITSERKVWKNLEK
jgi:hypothetical protein